MKQYVVRIVQTCDVHGKDNNEGGEIPYAFLDSLRYAGLIDLHTVARSLTTVCFDIQPPPNVDSKVWAEQNAARMKTFGFNAEAAPSTRDSK